MQHVPTRRVEAPHSAGAGDTLAAALGLGLAAGAKRPGAKKAAAPKAETEEKPAAAKKAPAKKPAAKKAAPAE